jgi:hypothetical protein
MVQLRVLEFALTFLIRVFVSVFRMEILPCIVVRLLVLVVILLVGLLYWSDFWRWNMDRRAMFGRREMHWTLLAS